MKHTSIGMGITLILAMSADSTMDRLGPFLFLVVGAVASLAALILIEKGEEENG